jgi:hypothetical protein
MSRLAKPSSVTAYRVKIPLQGFTRKLMADTVIPVGSTLEWQQGDYSGGMASVFWLRRRVLVMESDLFKHCERVMDDPSTLI